MNGHNETLEELSQIWLHALAVRAGFAYERSGRQLDNLGVDATVHTGNGLLAPEATAASFPIEFQLRATAGLPVSKPKGIPFRLRRLDYERLRLPVRREPLLLAVLYFPSDQAEWLVESADGIGIHGQAFWANLRGAPKSVNDVYQTVYLSMANRLTVNGLRELAVRLARGEPTGGRHE